MKSNLPEPKFEEEGFYFKVTLEGPNGNLIIPRNATAEDFKDFNLNGRQIDAMLKMKNEELKLTFNDYASIYDVSKTTAKRDLNALLEKGLARKIVIDQDLLFLCLV